MAASGHTALNDRELRTELKRLGFNAGPVTDSTRKIYLKKLGKLQAEEKLKVNLPTSAVPGRKLLGFSSDESDGESAAGNRRRSMPVASKGLRRRSLKVRPHTPYNGTADDHGDTPAKSTKPPSEGSRLNSSSKSKRYSTGMLPSAGPSIDRTKSKTRGSLLAGRDAVSKSRVAPTPGKGEFSDSDVDEEDNEEDNEEEDEDNNDVLTEPQMTETTTNSSKYEERNRNSRGRMNDTYTKDHVNSEANDLSSTGNKPSGLWWSTARPSPRQSLPKSLTPRTSTPRKSNRLRLSDAYDDEVDVSQLNAARNNNSNTLAPASRNNINSRNPNLNQSKSSSSKLNNVSLPRSTSSSFLNSKINHTPRSHPNAYQPDRSKSTSNPRSSDLPEREENLYEEFATEDHSATSLGSRIGHHVPMILLSCAFLFFVILGMVYMNVGTENLEDSKYLGIDDGSSQSWKTAEMNHIEAMKIVQALYVKLSDLAGKYECQAPEVTSKNMTTEQAKLFLKYEFRSEIAKQSHWLDRYFEYALQKIVNNTQWGLRLYNSKKEPLMVEEGNSLDPMSLMEQTVWLESLQPQMSWMCRVQRSAVLVIFRLVVFSLVVLMLWLVYKYTMYRMKRDREEKQRMLELVDEINEMLRSHQMAYNKDKSLSPYLAIPHVRDTLIPLKHRREKQQLWDRAVLFINTHESRVRMETQQIAGEEFLVWRWILPSPVVASFTPMTELELNPNRVKVWQGTAFDNLDTAIKTPRYTPTPCLKIRNMFDPTLEADGDWHVTIEDAILERCADNDGIVHVAVDRTSREGCVYVKCATPDSAGRAYRALQGSWFDGKLVTVKYLRLDRYHQRFPFAVNFNTPLRPSNNLKKSLSHPSQSTSLESS